MSDLQTQFETAVADSKNLTERPDNATLLKLYALYKQGSSGDNLETKPGFSDLIKRAKWEAWSAIKGQTNQEAMQAYIEKMASLN